MNASVAARVGAATAFMQGKPHIVILYGYPVLAVVENGDAESRIGQVGPLMVTYFKLSFIGAVVFVGRSFNVAELGFKPRRIG